MDFSHLAQFTPIQRGVSHEHPQSELHTVSLEKDCDEEVNSSL